MGGSRGGWNVHHQDLYGNMRENTILQENIRERERERSRAIIMTVNTGWVGVIEDVCKDAVCFTSGLISTTRTL